MPYKWMSKEETKRVTEAIKENVRIEDYASSCGFHVVRKGKYLSLKEMDSIMIDTVKNCFYRNSGIGNRISGSVIDFAMNVKNLSFSEAFMELQDYINVGDYMDYPDFSSAVKAKEKAVEQKVLELPQKAQNMRRVYAYLLKSRHLEPDVVQDFVDRDMLYQDVHGNCCFVGYDEQGKANYGFLRGTNTQRRFIGDVPGCDYTQGFYIHNGAEKLIISESVIDAASVMSVLHAQGYDFKDYDYYAMAGTGKLEGFFQKVKTRSYDEILMAPDSDEAGKISVGKVEKFLEENQIDARFSVHYPMAKDWNQDLVNVRSKFGDIYSLHFFQDQEGGLIQEDDSPHITISSFKKVDGMNYAFGKMDGELFSSPIWRKGKDYFLKFKNGMRYDFSHQDTLKLEKFVKENSISYRQSLEQRYNFQKDRELEI